MPIDNAGSNPSWHQRVAKVAVAVLLIVAMVLPGYTASYNTIKEADGFSPVLAPLGAFAFTLLWSITLLCTIRAVIKLYDLRLEHPGWRATFTGINTALESAISQHTSVKLSFDSEALLKPYFLLPITKAGLLRLSIASYFMTIYGYALIYKFIAMAAPDMFTPKPLDLSTAIYFSIVTIATVGYGDVLPLHQATKILVSTEILAGVAYSVFFFSILANLIREHDRQA
ncbi:voltage-gated potassium channel Kch [Bradyrhizobium sp. USDA 4503]